ncbi:MAG TPA: DNA primase [Candidatus Rokubacteria bacterium]|nr:MAG: DNA primase [Candidatus Rokubacteria bacterium GWF2_70_14]HAM55523.1 DNA primase [Candidatus Rokubacteria bacterium]
MNIFSASLLEEIRSRVDMVEMVGQFVNLKRAGENWKGLCPFHTEKTPSFTVHPKKGIFHCFGCGAGGDAFGFLMRQDRLAFPEAVRLLAQRAGVELPSERRPEAADGKIEALRQIMARAAEFYAEALWAPGGDKARRYLEGRGVDPEVARRFGLGYAPEGWDHLLAFMRGQSVAEEGLAQAGLVLPRQTGSGFYDRFRGRLLFTIRDGQGRVVAFGGRALGPEEPKYLNSPETPLYVKGQILYALDLAKGAMRERNRAIVVEGYLDCLMAHQHGFTETVAALGTAFTQAQLALLQRSADEIVAVFDADAAGQKAAARIDELMSGPADLRSLGWSMARTGGFERAGHFPVKVAVLPPGHDPDSLLRSQGADAFRSRVDEARSILSFVMAQALAEENLASPRGRATAHARVALVLSKVPNAEEATALAQQAARELGVDPTQLWIEAQQLQRARFSQGRGGGASARATLPSTGAGWPPPNLAERDLLSLLLQVEEARVSLLPGIEDDDIAHPGLRALLAALREAPGSPAEALMTALPGDGERGLLAALLLEERSWSDVRQQIGELQRRYEIRRRKKRIRQVTQAIIEAQATGDPALPQLEAELGQLQREAEAVRELSLTPAAGPPAPGRPTLAPGSTTP